VINTNQLKKTRAELKDRAEALNERSRTTGVLLTEAENVEFVGLVKQIEVINQTLDQHAAGAVLADERDQQLARIIPSIPGSGAGDPFAIRVPRNAGGANGLPGSFSEAINFARTGQLAAPSASLTESGDAQYTFPATLPINFLQAFGQVDALALAGATVHAQDGVAGATLLKVNILAPGTDATTYAEGSGPSSTSDPTISTLSIAVAKYGLLLQPTEELLEDVQGLTESLVSESLARVLNSVSKADVAAFKASLLAAGAVTDVTTDAYTDTLQLVDGIATIFRRASNRFIMSPVSHMVYMNTRDLNNRPLLDFSAGGGNGRLFGYDIVLADSMGPHVAFGNFEVACHLRRLPATLLRLNEAYREDGKIGLRFTQRAGRAFYSDAVTDPGADQPVLMTGTNWGS